VASRYILSAVLPSVASPGDEAPLKEGERRFSFLPDESYRVLALPSSKAKPVSLDHKFAEQLRVVWR
jgi:hypothetical protein